MIIVNSVTNIAGGYKCERVLHGTPCKQKATKRVNLKTSSSGPGDYLFCDDCTEDLLTSKNIKYEGK